MNKIIKNKFPSWVNDDKEYDLLLSDDIDSLMCYIFQKEKFNRQVKYFIDVNYKKTTPSENGIQRLYGAVGYHNSFNNIIGLDIAIDSNIKCWDNHVVKNTINDTVNPYSANINAVMGINKSNYTDKYVISTFITMLAYYEIDISKWSYEQLCVLCAIDGLYYPFRKWKFREIGYKNLENLSYGFLGDFIVENSSDIEAIEEELNLKNGKIKVKDGYLTTDIDLEGLSQIFKKDIKLPRIKLEKRDDFECYLINDLEYVNKEEITDRWIFNFALHYKNSCYVSI